MAPRSCTPPSISSAVWRRAERDTKARFMRKNDRAHHSVPVVAARYACVLGSTHLRRVPARLFWSTSVRPLLRPARWSFVDCNLISVRLAFSSRPVPARTRMAFAPKFWWPRRDFFFLSSCLEQRNWLRQVTGALGRVIKCTFDRLKSSITRKHGAYM